MKKNLILEIERINFLMNNTLLIEQSGAFVQFIETLVKNSPQSIKNLERLIKKARVAGEKLSDEDISRVIRELKESGGLTDDEIEALTKTFRKDADIKKILQDSNNFLDDFRRLTKKTEVPKSLESLIKISELTDSQINSVINNTVNSLFKNKTSNVYKLYNSVINTLGPYIDNLIKNKYLISNSEDFYTLIDNELNKSIKADVDAGRITEEQGKEFFKKISTEIRTNSSIKNKIDDMIDEGLVLGKKSKYKKIKFGDPPIKIHLADIIEWEVIPTDIKDLNTGIPLKKPKDPFEDAIDFEEEIRDLSRWKKFYLNRIEPYIRWWAKGFELQFDEMLGVTFETRRQEFLDAFQRGLNQFTTEGKKGLTKKNQAYYRDIIEKFQMLPRESNFFTPKNKTIYEFMWDDFEKKARLYFKDSPDDLQKFKEFVSELKDWKSFGDKNIAMKELLEGSDFSQASFKDIKTRINGILDTKINDELTKFKLACREKLIKGAKALYYKFMSGIYKSPADISRELTKELKNVKSRVVRKGEKVFTTVYSKKAAVNYTMQRIIYSLIVVPAIISAFEGLIEGAASSVDIKLVDRPWLQPNPDKNPATTAYNVLIGYVAYDVLTGIKLDEILSSATGLEPAQQSWINYTLDYFPGSRDDLWSLALESLAYYGFVGEGEDLEKKAKTELENTKKTIEEKGWVPRELSEQGPKKHPRHNEFLQFLASPATLRKPDDFPDFNAKLMASRVRSNDLNFWIEDFRYDKKYFVTQPYTPYEFSQKIQNGEEVSAFAWKDGDKIRTLNELNKEFSKNLPADLPQNNLPNTEDLKEKIPINNENYKIIKNILMENTPRTKFGEDNFKHWKDTFVFKAEDEKNPGQFKQVKINMEDVMDRINHYRKKYDEDDAFVRAVLDTHDNVVKVMYTKDLADISESALPRGLALVLREDRGELEIFSVSRPANGNWFLVKGDYTPSQLANMDLEKKEPEDKESTKMSKTEDDLKKKEEESIILLKRNEKEGLIDLPRKVKQKLKEKISKGWTTEEPPSYLMDFYTTSQINSVFNDPIEIYKLESSPSYFATLVKYSARVTPKRGFCRSLQMASRGEELNERQRKTINHILTRCKSKLAGKFGIASF
jgi:hypothetical protein